MTTVLRNRQIHLDFHTARDIPSIGEDFRAAEFAATAVEAAVDSMTVFAKCHHGFSYYPTSVGTQHPSLQFDLLGQQIAALHSVGIRAPVYVSILWDDLAGEEHTDWVITRRDGSTLMRPPLTDHSPLKAQVGWTTLDVATGYGDYVAAQVTELCALYEIDGFFFDIVWAEPNYSPAGLKRLREAGVLLDDEAAVRAHSTMELARFLDRLTSIVVAAAPAATIFFNGLVDAELSATVSHLTHIEVESLPTSGALWGYTHFPVVARFARTFGKPILGMTGRFHQAWADFGGLKTIDQLTYECGTILGAGGAISIGDQLDPHGRLDAAVYRTIGAAFRRVRQLEPWLESATAVAEVAVIAASHREAHASRTVAALTPDCEGTAQVLLELGIQFDIVDPDATKLLGYLVVVIPDGYQPGPSALAAIEEARAGGAHIIVSGTACLQDGSFTLPHMPVQYISPAPTEPSYLRPTEPSRRRPELALDYDYVFYDKAHLVKPLGTARTSGHLRRARYSRTWAHFTSHAQAPVGDDLDAPVIVTGGSVTYLAAPLFGAYRRHEYWVYRALLEEEFERLLPARVVRLLGPAWVEGTVHRQEAEEGPRTIVHLTAYHPRRTSHPVAHVDESGLTAGLVVSVALPRAPIQVYLAPDRTPIPFTYDNQVVCVEMPPVGTHTVLVVV